MRTRQSPDTPSALTLISSRPYARDGAAHNEAPLYEQLSLWTPASTVGVIDEEGNMVALTTTINLSFGSHQLAAGILLNDQMDDFSAQPAQPNAFGLIGGAANEIAPAIEAFTSTY